MLIFNYKFGDSEQEDKILTTIGKPYKFLQRVKMGGSGSERMPIVGASFEILNYIEQFNATAYANFEIRPSGVLIIIAQNTRRIAWAIPYHYLSVFKSQSLNLHAEGSFVKLEMKSKRQMFVMNKLLESKNKHLKSLEDFLNHNENFTA
jgi:hypothetical protein